jgi:hypothetical protein
VTVLPVAPNNALQPTCETQAAERGRYAFSLTE